MTLLYSILTSKLILSSGMLCTICTVGEESSPLENLIEKKNQLIGILFLLTATDYFYELFINHVFCIITITEKHVQCTSVHIHDPAT